MKLIHKLRAGGVLALLGRAAMHAEIRAGDLFPGLPAEVPAFADKIGLANIWTSWREPGERSIPVYGRVRQGHAGFHGTETDRERRREIVAQLAEPHPLS
jgi:hypothetical protein